VKLREEFQVGVDQPKDLAAILTRARVVLAACNSSATVMKTKGWTAADTTKLQAAITALDAADDTQETAKDQKKGTTGERNEQANELFERLLAIQNAANLEWPADMAGNEAIRGQFRLGTFPPKSRGKGKKSEEKKPEPPVA
jgi:hypothetical protein